MKGLTTLVIYKITNLNVEAYNDILGNCVLDWSLSYTQRHCHVRIEKGSVQTTAIHLEAHNSQEYHYMLKH